MSFRDEPDHKPEYQRPQSTKDVLNDSSENPIKSELFGNNKGGLYANLKLIQSFEDLVRAQYDKHLPPDPFLQDYERDAAARHTFEEARLTGGSHKDHADSDLPTIRWGKTSKAEADQLWNTYEQLPEAERFIIGGQGTVLNVGLSLRDYKPELSGRPARGQTGTQDTVPAFFDAADNSINVTLRPEPVAPPESHPSGSRHPQSIHQREMADLPASVLQDDIKHETGHAIDNFYLGFSQHKPFADAYEKDRDAILSKFPPDERTLGLLNYFISPFVGGEGARHTAATASLGESEVFAEMYSAMRTSPEQRTETQRAVVENFPNVLRVENELLQELNYVESLRPHPLRPAFDPHLLDGDH